MSVLDLPSVAAGMALAAPPPAAARRALAALLRDVLALHDPRGGGGRPDSAWRVVDRVRAATLSGRARAARVERMGDPARYARVRIEGVGDPALPLADLTSGPSQDVRLSVGLWVGYRDDDDAPSQALFDAVAHGGTASAPSLLDVLRHQPTIATDEGRWRVASLGEVDDGIVPLESGTLAGAQGSEYAHLLTLTVVLRPIGGPRT